VDVKKIYANNADTGILVCDQCGLTKSINVANLKNVKKPIKVTCQCGSIFFITIETRKYYRKKTNLHGECSIVRHDIHKGMEKWRMTVDDISRSGIGFRTQSTHSIQAGDLIRVTFTLDNDKKSEITKNAIARRVDGYFIGAAFVDADAYTEANRMLGFYLMPR